MNKTIILIALLFNSVLVFAQTKEFFPRPQIEYNPKYYICYKSDGTIIIDGKINEELWSKTEWTDLFVDIEGELKQKPYYETKVKMLWDDKYFYFAAFLQEEHIWAKLKEKDTVIYYDNDFEIFIDPDGDTHNYYELELNAFETIWDLLLIKPYRDAEKVAVNAWDITDLKVAVDINGTLNNPTEKDEYWTVEVAIPWSSIKELSYTAVPPKHNNQWKVNFSRVQWETEVVGNSYIKKKNIKTGRDLPENNWVWSPQGLIAMHYPETWGIVQFSENIAGAKKNEIIISELDKAKWALRNIYYAQKDYHTINKKYAKKIEQLLVKKYDLKDFYWEPTIQATDNTYEISIDSKDRKNKLVIYNDGLIKLLKK